MRTLRTSEAAALLSVSATTLREWERTFGYPRPARSPGKHRRYDYAELVALREALGEGLGIASAVSVVREAESSQLPTLLGPLHGFDAERADHAMECALAVRSLESAVNDVLLPALHEIERRDGVDSASWSFALGWATEWIMRSKRVVQTAPHAHRILIGDATRDHLDVDTLYLRAFELFCLRGAIGVLCLQVQGYRAVAAAVAASEPDGVVLVGSGASDVALQRFKSAVQRGARRMPTFAYRGADAAAGSVLTLPPCPVEAHRELLELLELLDSGLGARMPAVVRRQS